MSSRLLFVLFCIASVSTGCIVKDEDGCDNCNPPPPPPPALRGDVTFLWTFAGGLRCDQVREVWGVNVTIPGEQLQNNGKYDCSTAGKRPPESSPMTAAASTAIAHSVMSAPPSTAKRSCVG